MADENGLVLRLHTANANGKVFVLRFKGRVPAHRQIVEECRLTTFRHNSSEKGQFWKVENSKWLSEFGETDRIHYPKLTHYLIETGNRCVDVLSDSDPIAGWA